MKQNEEIILIQAAAKGDTESFNRLCERYYPVIVAIAYSQLTDRALAEDAAQEAFFAAFRNLSKLKRADHFGRWLVRICRNIAVDMAKARKKETLISTKDCYSVSKEHNEQDNHVEAVKKIIRPTFIIHHPVKISPLAKQLDKDPTKTARFQLVAAGLELLNAFTELNDPLEQDKRFKEQEENRQRGDQEAQRYDKDFVEALEYGMPPAGGLGMGLDRLISLLTDSHNLREVILFPLMRPKE